MITKWMVIKEWVTAKCPDLEGFVKTHKLTSYSEEDIHLPRPEWLNNKINVIEEHWDKEKELWAELLLIGSKIVVRLGEGGCGSHVYLYSDEPNK